MEPMPPAVEVQKLRILTAGPPGKSQQNYFLKILWGPCGHKTIWQTEFLVRNSSKERQDIRNISSLAENGTKEVVLIVIWVNRKEKPWNFTKFLKGMCGPAWQLRLPGSPDSRATLLWGPHPLISSFHQASTGCRKKNGTREPWDDSRYKILVSSIDLYLVYMKKSYNSITKRQTPQFQKIEKELIFQRIYVNGLYAYENSTSWVIRETSNKTTWHPTIPHKNG